MICHKHRCIFIHIPRTAGTSIETCINPNWTFENFREEKHILASTARKIYRDYWDEYFKFSFVRNPWDRMVSMSKYGSFYGCQVKSGKLDVMRYQKKFPRAEIDPRSKSAGDKTAIIHNAVYLNILNEELDFIGRFESLKEDYQKVCSIIKCSKSLSHKEAGKNKEDYTKFYDIKTQKLVSKIYRKDIEYFNYKFKG